MFTLKRTLELVFLGLVYLSAALLGFSQDNWQLALISVIGATAAWILVDWLNWFRMPRWLANILSIGVLIFTMQNFFKNESSLQLLAVADLLVYLQTILLFQEKTPRQYWQLAVLNLLQVVVATIFTLQFEGGFMFLAYMTVAGVMLMLITLETEATPAGSEFSMRTFLDRRSRRNLAAQAGKPELRFNPPEQLVQRLPGMLGYLFGWALISVCFSCVLFVLVPRNQSAWFGPKYKSASATGISKKMELDPRGELKIDTTAVLRVEVKDPVSKQPVVFSSPIYLRGLALGDWNVENGITNWSAPYDRLDRFSYETLPKVEARRAWYDMEYTVEPTSDPLLYGALPAYLPSGAADELDFSLELAALSRKRDVQRIEQSPFKYRLWVPKPSSGGLPGSWPYSSGSTAKSALTMAGNPNERKWLLRMDPSRYPKVVEIAKRIAAEVGPDRPLELARALESHFVNSSDYFYTLDFTQVPRTPNVDPIEDFVANHKSGHCEMYASALTLMLRSQGIPARVVVGYVGGNFLNWTNSYTFTNEHAHAWVEAYISPENCTEEMFRDETAGPGGAWLSLDPTPPANLRRNANGNGNQALDIARTMWQEYVLGMDEDAQQRFNSSSGILSLLRLDALSNSLQQGFAQIQQSPEARLWVSGILIFVILGFILGPLLRKRRARKSSIQSAGLLRRLVGKAIGLISPRFGQWLMTGSSNSPVVPFYQRLVETLAGKGLTRQTGETHREFLNRVSSRCVEALAVQPSGTSGKPFSELGTEPQPAQLLAPIESAFHAVRFGAATLEPQEMQRLESNLLQVERLLATIPASELSSTKGSEDKT